MDKNKHNKYICIYIKQNCIPECCLSENFNACRKIGWSKTGIDHTLMLLYFTNNNFLMTTFAPPLKFPTYTTVNRGLCLHNFTVVENIFWGSCCPLPLAIFCHMPPSVTLQANNTCKMTEYKYIKY